MDEIGENGVEADKEVFGNEVKDHDNGREEVEVENKGLDDKSNEYGVEEECTVNDETESPVKTNNENAKSSYVNATLNACLDNTLTLIPTEIGTDGIEVVIFDDEIVKESSKKWELTSVIENRPWMVNRKPMFVQKWDPIVCLDRAEPNKLPLPKTAKEVKEITKAEAKKKVETNDFVEDDDPGDEGLKEKEMGTMEEDNDIFEEVTGSASKMAQKELHSSYASVLNGLGRSSNGYFK
ncbi:hypothetical protein Tco_0914478 [Tanacetum coccineum]